MTEHSIAGGDSAPADDAIVVTGLGKRYGELTAVDDVSFTIARGEVFALLGPNGAGKTTTIELLEGFRVPSSGRVRVLGVDPARGDADWRARIGVVSQSSADIERFTCREILAHFASLYPRPRDVDEVLEAVGLTEKARTSVRKLSGGQQRRLDVALGIVGRPEVLFLDEPTTGFDPEARRQFWRLIERLRDEGTTILLTTHYLDEAEHLSDRVGVIARGRLIDLATVALLGGAEARTPIVRWTAANGERRAQRTETPGTLVASLVTAAGAEPDGLEIHRPTLEDIYLDLIHNAEDA
ncbi:ABC transporter [Pseudoclavibacter endophyticus]|uniref:ABC transporter ATP-binding protein n=1 Tax=Pseudoclavibacter endophyticus TaxID=1778590 RepID=A0A6H9WN91_9MICO|nr:ABC transporter ATP-binding protein [Pseudoclavibacter endophyticus]KAB1648096.1 ABC transporter ATP-binding protein [Pseudoclavibacter endophyticus]GGA69687.1 ABC transporter [Pseudoclavibacter endophyticus]